MVCGLQRNVCVPSIIERTAYQLSKYHEELPTAAPLELIT